MSGSSFFAALVSLHCERASEMNHLGFRYPIIHVEPLDQSGASAV